VDIIAVDCVLGDQDLTDNILTYVQYCDILVIIELNSHPV
jgi:hypothetical protein